MKVPPDLWLVVGPNGAGKTSFLRNRAALLPENVVFLNADERT